MDLEFQVNALYGGRPDRRPQRPAHERYDVSRRRAGLTFAPSPRWRITGELFYSWLSITRPPATTSANEGFFNGRVFVSYRVH